MISLWGVGFLILWRFGVVFYVCCGIFHHSECRFVHISYFSSGVRLVFHCDCILSVFFSDGPNRVKAFVSTLKCVTANCQTKTDYGPFLSLSFF